MGQCTGLHIKRFWFYCSVASISVFLDETLYSHLSASFWAGEQMDISDFCGKPDEVLKGTTYNELASHSQREAILEVTFMSRTPG